MTRRLCRIGTLPDLTGEGKRAACQMPHNIRALNDILLAVHLVLVGGQQRRSSEARMTERGCYLFPSDLYRIPHPLILVLHFCRRDTAVRSGTRFLLTCLMGLYHLFPGVVVLII